MRPCRSRPDAFLPDLAVSLAVTGKIHLDHGTPKDGLAFFAEGIGVLSGLFERYPAAFAGQISGFCRYYITACEAAGEEPDHELLGPIEERLQAMAGPDDGAPGP